MAEVQKKYRASARFIYLHPGAVTSVPVKITDKVDLNAPRVTVALGETPIKVEQPGTATTPPREMTIQPATQEQLAYLYNVEKNPHIEEV